MSHLRQKGDKSAYWVLNDQCIGCSCFQPGHYQSRGATMSGSRNTGDSSACCLRNAYHGCPSEGDREYSEDLKKQRKAEGWKRA